MLNSELDRFVIHRIAPLPPKKRSPRLDRPDPVPVTPPRRSRMGMLSPSGTGLFNGEATPMYNTGVVITIGATTFTVVVGGRVGMS